MRVRHFGNTANNAYYNALLLKQYGGIESDLPIRMFGLEHAISAPAWEAVDFEVPGADWVARPGWSMIPGAVAVNSEYSDLEPPVAPGTTASLPSRSGLRARAMSVARGVLEPQYGKAWAQPIFDLSYRWVVLGRRPVLPELEDRVDVLYGAGSLMKLKMPSSRFVCLEHGTIRWIADGGRETAVFRRAYREQVQRAAHLWVTNLDPRTLEIAEDVAPGRWSVLPHPYLPDSRVPFPESAVKRQGLLTATRSEHLVLLPSSQNWAKTHDKGSMKALTAFVELRRKGVDVGLVAVEWGLQLAESKAFLDTAGVGMHVAWVAPMARFGLQRMMANVDVVWDQFALEAFGGLSSRAVEQGTPFVSRGLAPIGEQFIGGPVPWLQAATMDDIVRETTGVLEDMAKRGRDRVIAAHRARYRAWLLDRHSPALTVALQQQVYKRLLDGTFEPGTVAPDQWAKHLDVGPRGNEGAGR